MVTGIITDIGEITAITDRGDLHIEISTAYDMDSVAVGASIACSGVCLTVVEKAPGRFRVDVSAETLRHTAKGQWVVGRQLNLERALKVGDELGGHIVTGHVDAVGVITDKSAEGASTRFGIRVPASIAPFIAPKGSVALDGVSLTVNDVVDAIEGTVFFINVIPHTGQWTTFGAKAVGDELNIEIDVLARYLARMRQLVD
ncbi:riboflavin synthase [Polymorphobacter sp.]|uniref:riboflavin synthase n=1 Tax=Polymorphobacter sp. TaxID=1909290 RepID=UPI003F70455A